MTNKKLLFIWNYHYFPFEKGKSRFSDLLDAFVKEGYQVEVVTSSFYHMNSTPKNSVDLAWLIRRDSIEMTHVSGASHIGSDLSAADAIAVLYFDVMRIDPKKPEDPNRDIFLMGKGHASAALYSALANRGFFSRERLKTFYQNGSTLSGHVTKHNNPGIEFSTGSLGHGQHLFINELAQKEKDKNGFD